MTLEFEMSVLSDLGGRWDVFFLPEVIPKSLYIVTFDLVQIVMFDPAAVATKVESYTVTSEVAHASFLYNIYDTSSVIKTG